MVPVRDESTCGGSEQAPALYHFRDPRGRDEIDIIAEAPDGRVVAVEVRLPRQSMIAISTISSV
jgi:hypothetical protein